MGHSIITQPTVEPITLAEAKVQCKVDADITADNDLITGLITSAREQAEHRTGRCLIEQTHVLTLNAFPTYSLDLIGSPLISVVSVKYIDGNGTLQTLPAPDYQVIDDELVGRIIPAYGLSWPSARLQPGSVQVEYKVGYGAAAADVPVSIKSWMKMAVATLYANRESVVTGTIAELPRDYMDGLLDPYRIYRL